MGVSAPSIATPPKLSSHLPSFTSLSFAKMITLSIKDVFDPMCPWYYVSALRLTYAIDVYRKTVCANDIINII